MAGRTTSMLEEENRLLREIARGEECSSTLRDVATFAMHYLRAVGSSLQWFDPEKLNLRHSVSIGLPEAYVSTLGTFAASPHDGGSGQALHRLKPIVSADIATDPGWGARERTDALKHGLRACWSLPLADASGGLLGALTVYFSQSRRPTAEEQDVMSAARQLAELVLERERWQRQQSQRARHSELLLDFRRNIMELVEESLKASRPNEFYSLVLTRAVKVLKNAQGGSVLLRDDDGWYSFVATYGFELSALREVRLAPTTVWVDPYDPQPTIVREPGLNVGFTRAEREVMALEGRADQIRAVLVVPVIAQGAVTAYLTLDNFEDPDAFGSDDLEFAKVFAGQVGVLLRRFQLEADLERMAYEDSLTGAANRARVLLHLPSALERALESRSKVALAFLDLDDVKAINDAYGHSVGDEMLKAAAARLMRSAGSRNLVARLGGDEFVVVVEGPTADLDAKRLADRFFAALTEPVYAHGHTLFVGASIGIGVFPDFAADSDDLLRQANIAMHQAKRSGKFKCVNFLPEMETAPRERMALEAALRLALERNELVVHYQPRVDLATGQITCLEALVRWQHPKRGLIPPAAFIPLAEATDLIKPLGRQVLRLASAQAKEWHAAGLEWTRVAVNLSARQMDDPRLALDVQEILEAAGLPPSALELEVLESEAVRDVRATGERLGVLRRLGVTIALDDFGMGYSNLAFLQRMPMDVLKIDRGLLVGLGAGGEARDPEVTVQAIVALGKGFGLRVVAEGVEDLKQWRRLQEMGCDEAQGYLLCRPTPAEQLWPVLRAGRIVPQGG